MKFTLKHQDLLASLNMAPTEMIQDAIPISYQLPATLLCSPALSSPEHSRLSSKAESSSLLQSAQASTTDDFERLDSKLKKAQLYVLVEKPRDGEAVAHEL